MESSLELVTRVLSGDVSAEKILIKENANYLSAVIFRARVFGADVEDLAQETFLRAFRDLATLRDRAKFRTWLTGIARHLIADYWEKRKREGMRGELDDTIPDPTIRVDAWMIQEDLRRQLLTAVESLPPQQRRVVSRRLNHHWTFNEIAESLGISLNAAKQSYYKGLNKLLGLLS